MLKEERWAKILELVDTRGFVKNNELARLTDSTIQTIISDINSLDKENRVIKVYGGAKSIFEHKTNRESFDEEKINLNSFEKDLIAKTAADLVEEKDYIFLDTGTSTKKLIKYLADKDIKIVTNGYSIALELMEQDIEVCLVGGTIIPSTHATAGVLSLKFLENFYFDKAFIGINNVDKEGMYTTNIEEAMIKEKVIKCSKKAFILCDSSKYGKKNSVKVVTQENTTIISEKAPKFDLNNIIIAKNE